MAEASAEPDIRAMLPTDSFYGIGWAFETRRRAGKLQGFRESRLEEAFLEFMVLGVGHTSISRFAKALAHFC